MREKIILDCVDNVRELGGIKTQDGRTIKKGMLFRGGKISEMSDNDKKFFKDNNITLIADFRSLGEIKINPDAKIDGANYVNFEMQDNEVLQKIRSGGMGKEFFGWIISENTKDPNFGTNYMIQTYKNLVSNEACNKEYGRFIDCLAQNEGGVYWHCNSGKDRTGIAAIIILSILGVSKEDIYEDYIFSNECIMNDDRAVKNHIKMSELDEGYFEEFKDFLSVKEEYFKIVYEIAESLCGTMNAFLEVKLGVTKEKKEILRKKYLE